MERDDVAWPAAYFRLVLDTFAELSAPPPNGQSQWYLPQLTRYLRGFQARQSLLMWAVFTVTVRDAAGHTTRIVRTFGKP